MPAQGTSTNIPTPAPNPAQFNFSAGQTIYSSQVNSNFYKVYNDIDAIVSALNGCAYAPGAAFSSVNSTPPIIATVGSCVGGTGTQLTLTFDASALNVPVNSLTAATSVSAVDINSTGTANLPNVNVSGSLLGPSGYPFVLDKNASGDSFVKHTTISATVPGNSRAAYHLIVSTPFSSPPVVVCSVLENGSFGSTPLFGCDIGSPNPTGTDIYINLYNFGSTSATVAASLIAIGS